jgi:hypothetical protein
MLVLVFCAEEYFCHQSAAFWRAQAPLATQLANAASIATALAGRWAGFLARHFISKSSKSGEILNRSDCQ